MCKAMKTRALLFDFDGVVVDSEKFYTILWDALGEEYLQRADFGNTVKGSTLNRILSTYFDDRKDLWPTIVERLDEFEKNMPYDYIPGVVEFLKEGRRRGFSLAVVTSSNLQKMHSVYAKRPEIPELFDAILTSEDFAASKPDPDCFLRGMARFGTDAAHCVVFEDSVNGLKSGKASGALVIGLTTTNPPEVVREYSSLQIPDFTDKERIFEYIEDDFPQKGDGRGIL